MHRIDRPGMIPWPTLRRHLRRERGPWGRLYRLLHRAGSSTLAQLIGTYVACQAVLTVGLTVGLVLQS